MIEKEGLRSASVWSLGSKGELFVLSFRFVVVVVFLFDP